MTDPVDLRLERLTKERENDFLALMARDEHEGAQCWCVAWWVPTWEAYLEQTPDAEVICGHDPDRWPEVRDTYR